MKFGRSECEIDENEGKEPRIGDELWEIYPSLVRIEGSEVAFVSS